MAHWAEIDDNNIVVRVTVGNNNDPDEGYNWLVENLGGTWIKTSYNTNAGVHLLGGTPLRKNFASVGFTYDLARDAFIAPKPYDSWILDEESCTWEAPISYPDDGTIYEWDESVVNWIEVQGE